MKNWRPEHGKTIYDFLEYLNRESDDFILKGGTALLTCYELDEGKLAGDFLSMFDKLGLFYDEKEKWWNAILV